MAGVACCVAAAGLVVYGVLSVANGPAIDHPSGLGVSHAVGSFLPALLALILGLGLLRKKGPL
jgi:hypothetical protein